MSNVLTTTPIDQSRDVVLGTSIVVTFDSLMNTATITPATFSVTDPNQTQILTSTQLIASDPKVLTGREFINGTFTFSTNSSNQTVAVFTPTHPLQPNITYTILLVGAGASLLPSSTIKDINGVALTSNYVWSFSTGTLNTKTPPLQSPQPYQYASIDPNSIKVRVNNGNAGDLLNQNLKAGYEIDLIFPKAIDPTTFDPTSILLSLEQFLGDPTVPMPTNLVPAVSLSTDNTTIKIILQGD
ncbi:MAG: Ig-like domain-containing protein [Janthinobacterium lividum]